MDLVKAGAVIGAGVIGILVLSGMGSAGASKTGGGAGSTKKGGIVETTTTIEESGGLISGGGYNIFLPPAPTIDFPEIPYNDLLNGETKKTIVSTQKPENIPREFISPKISRPSAQKYGISYQLAGRLTKKEEKSTAQEVILKPGWDYTKGLGAL